MSDLEKEILKLENELLLSKTTKSARRISEILDEEFTEYTSSGQEYHYKKGDVFQAEDDDSELNWCIFNFKIKELSKEYILATYKVIKEDEKDERKKYTLRSSIWRYYNSRWKMIFHQGTYEKR